MDTKRLMRDTRARLILAHPFFGFPSMNLELQEDPACETMATNGVILKYNPEWIVKLGDTERQTAIAHEAAHCMLGHVFRRFGRDMEIWNQACDYVVNEHLKANGFVLAPDALYDLKYQGMPAEQVYDKLRKTPPNQRPSQKPNDVQDCPGDNPQKQPSDAKPDRKPGKQKKPGKQEQPQGLSPQEVEGRWKVATIQAAQLSKAAGKEAAGMEVYVEAAKEPVMDWKSVLREFVAGSVPSDYRMFPPNRRHLWRGMYLPSIAKRPYPKLMVVLDTSGSISNELLSQFVCEVNAIMQEMRCAVHVVICDAEAHYAGVFDDEPIGDIKAVGRGGTDFRPPFDLADQMMLDLDGAVYLTDGYGTFPDSPRLKTLWVITSNVKAPCGETVRMPLN